MVASQEGPGMILGLAERMLETLFADGKLENQEQVEYYVSLLLRSQKFEAALTVLKSGAATNAFQINSQLQDAQARTLVLLERFGEASKIYCSLVSTVNSDEWPWYLGWFDNLFKTESRSYDEVRNLLHTLQKATIDDKSKNRGPFLAELEFSKRLVERSELDAIDVSLFKAYFEHFGGKSCFFRDVAPYVASLTSSQQSAVLELLISSLPMPEKPDTTDFAYRLASLESVRRALSAPEAKEKAVFLLKHFQLAKSLEIKKEVTERMHGDDLALLAAHYALDKRASVLNLCDAAATLEYAALSSRHNFQFRLLLVYIYSALGASTGVLRQLEELDMKQIQLDTMMHSILDTMATQLQFHSVISFSKRLHAFHEDNRKNTNDFVLEAYKNNRYSKVKEIGNFQHRLESSLQLVVARVSAAFAALAADAHTLDSTKEVLSSLFSKTSGESVPMTSEAIAKLIDNSDTTVPDSFGPPHSALSFKPRSMLIACFRF